MKKLIIMILSLTVLLSMLLAGCGNGGKQGGDADPEAAANINAQADDVAQMPNADSDEGEKKGNVHIIEGWPDDVPAPDFGGEIDANNLQKNGIDLTFRGVDPELTAQYVEKLKAAGFETYMDQHDKSMDGVYVDESGNPVIHHFFSAAKGEPVYAELVSGYYIEDGYYIEMGYSDVDEYNVDNGNLVSTPKVKLFLSWENPLVFSGN